MIKISFLLIFYHFFQIWFWRLYEVLHEKSDVFTFLQEFKPGHNFLSWQCLATCCQHDTTWPHVANMILQKLTDLEYETLPHPTYFPDLPPTHSHFYKALDIFLYQALDIFLCQKTFCSKGKIETAFQDLTSKLLEFSRTSIKKSCKSIDENVYMFRDHILAD